MAVERSEAAKKAIVGGMFLVMGFLGVRLGSQIMNGSMIGIWDVLVGILFGLVAGLMVYVLSMIMR